SSTWGAVWFTSSAGNSYGQLDPASGAVTLYPFRPRPQYRTESITHRMVASGSRSSAPMGWASSTQATPRCSPSTCFPMQTPACGAGFICCGTKCVNPHNDILNCGDCGKTCDGS